MPYRPLLLVLTAVTLVSAETPVKFSRDVLPILSQQCFACHGPDGDAREADLRLDQRQAAVDAGVLDLETLEDSELLRRIESTDPDEVMPPPDAKRTLSESAKATLRQWVKQGAPYERHWAFEPVERPSVPDLPSRDWARNEIDIFLLDAMRRAGVDPAPRADRYTLARRLYLDLIGLPPTPARADHFVDDDSRDAVGKLIESLMQSPHYGEHAARSWLDLARYADTNGYEKDRPRSIWPYRDWVIQALNEDMPFDQFTIEQLAGDMLPNSTRQQRVATGFHRNTMLNEEGGIDPLEYRFHAMVDRVATTGTVWLGLTIGCAQCHHHKYDPISHTDYFRFLALLNNADEPDLQLRCTATDAAVKDKIAKLEARLASQFPPDDGPGTEDERRHRNLATGFSNWIEDQRSHAAQWDVAIPIHWSTNLPKLELMPDHSLFASGDFTKRDEYSIQLKLDPTRRYRAIRLEALPDERLPAGGPGRAYYEGRKGDFFLSEIRLSTNNDPVNITSGARSYGRIAVGSGDAEAKNVFDNEGSTGWSTANREGERHVLVLHFAEPIQTKSLDVNMLFERHFVAGLGRFRFSLAATQPDRALDLPPNVEDALLTDPDAWDESLRSTVLQSFLRRAPELAEARKPIDGLREQVKNPTYTPVMQERPADNPRPTHRHHRGEWLAKREEVRPGLPQVFVGRGAAVTDRLALARWLASQDNPLVARVVVNRVWRRLMGYGLVRSDGDFGTQSTPPTHPELLDWLASEFMSRGWSLKQLTRLIVSSAAYQQQSLRRPRGTESDPTNQLFARGPRHRVDGETVRDILLAATGLLTPKVGGPSVFPPQPSEVTGLAYGGFKWQTSNGPDRYRRSIYTFRKRTTPFAAYTTFDGPSHEACVALRDRSNTPLQALTLLNDAMYLEMARHLARQVQGEGSSTGKITSMFRRLLTRPPRGEELDVLLAYHQRQQRRFEQNELNAAAFLDDESATPELASLTMVARVLMNLDETITKQ